MNEKVKLLIFYRVGMNHPADIHGTNEEIFEHLTTKEKIVRMYYMGRYYELAKINDKSINSLACMEDFVQDYNDELFDGECGLWSAIVTISQETMIKYLNNR